jgi:hypothetical protein
MWKPTTKQLELIDDLAHGGMSVNRIAAALGISLECFSGWTCAMAGARALDDHAVEMLLYPPRPVAIKAPPPPRHDPRIIAERFFEAAE